MTPTAPATMAAVRLHAPADPAHFVHERLDNGDLRPTMDEVFPLADARTAFERSLAANRRGKVVLRVAD